MNHVLTLDLGTKTGWCLLETLDVKDIIAGGTLNFSNSRFEGGGMKFLKFRKWLTDTKNTTNFSALYFEECRARQPSVAADHSYGGFLAHLTAWAEENKIAYEGVPVGTIKKFITGKGNANKKAVIEALKTKGYETVDDNQADALALGLYILKNS